MLSKVSIYIILSFVALIGVGLKVVAPHEGNFFRSVVALTVSRWFNLVLCNAGFAFLVGCFWITITIFFQKLHPLEHQHLNEKFFIFIAESILAVAMVKGQVSAVDVALFIVTCVVAMVHVVLIKRMNMLEESAMPVTKRRVISVAILSAGLFFVDAAVCLWLGSMVWGDGGFRAANASSSSARSAGIVLLLLMEWALNVAHCVIATSKLVLMAVMARYPAEVSNSLRFYVEIVTEIGKAVVYVVFGGMLLQQSTMPLHLVREILGNAKRIVVLVRDFVQHRKRMKWIEQVDMPTPEQLAEDCFCNICRDEVVNPATARILPCSHLFHVDCVAKWLERNRDCPYCNRDVEVMINEFVARKKREEHLNNGGDAAGAVNAANDALNMLNVFLGRHNPNANAAAPAAGGDDAHAVDAAQNHQQQQQQQQPARGGRQQHAEVFVAAAPGHELGDDALRQMYDQYVRHTQDVQRNNDSNSNNKNATAPTRNDSSKRASEPFKVISDDDDDDDDDEPFNIAASNSSATAAGSRNNSMNDEEFTLTPLAPPSVGDDASAHIARQMELRMQRQRMQQQQSSSSDQQQQQQTSTSTTTSAAAAASSTKMTAAEMNRRTIEAYMRFEKALVKARKQLTKELKEIHGGPSSSSPISPWTPSSLGPLPSFASKDVDDGGANPP